MHVLTVVGARPQFVKAAVVSRALTSVARESLIHTGQHYDDEMSRIFFEEMSIPSPVANLEVGSGSHGAMTGAMLAALEEQIVERSPDVVLVYGDTNSTLAGALAAAKLLVPVAHVEAGLRSFNRRMPEETNRVVTDHVADLLLCPAEPAADQLQKEGIDPDRIAVVGDVMVDALHFYRRQAVPAGNDRPFVLATVHRAENTDDPDRLRAILAAFDEAPHPVVLPLHPRTAAAMAQHGLAFGSNVEARPPASYFEMLGLLDACAFAMTDSGGLQKEAYVVGKRCVTLRDETEWTELVAAGANRIVGADSVAIRAAYDWALAPFDRDAMPALYGAGDAGARIVEILRSRYGS